MFIRKLNIKLLTLELLLFLLVLSISDIAFAGVGDEEEVAAFSSFIQTIIQTSQGLGQGSVCFIGSDAISKVISNDKSVINLNLDPNKYTLCKAIYISKDAKKSIRSDIEKFNSRKILTIAIFDGFTEIGGMLQIQMGRRNFELTLDKELAKKAGIKLNGLVMDLVVN